MTALDRHEADRLLTRLLELSPEERPAVLDAECDDKALRIVVRRLVRAAEGPGASVDPESAKISRLWSRLAARVAELETPIAERTILGRYRIIEEIDRGGMAVIYRAERMDGEFNRKVAIKILKLGFDTQEVVRRFERERQILADLDHPNVARLIDGGRTDDGRPYIVMELVEGFPIDQYCNEQRLPVEERLALFCVVATAVEYAHQNLVVHGDIKPANILVNEAGEVKLLDFGIARLLRMEIDNASSISSPTTQSLLRVMTPEYASPEQVRGERMTTASDVYQLGLLLYELLTGHRAYAVPDRGLHELDRAICEQIPTQPSAAVLRENTLKRGGGDRPPIAGALGSFPVHRASELKANHSVWEACRARSSSPARLRRRLRGDLDNIVLKALRKEPERRYGSADRLAQDVHRHLRGQPVSARADTWSYRCRKFLGRHALGAIAVAMALILLISLTLFYTIRIKNERDQAQLERVRAQEEMEKAEQVSQFLTRLFESVDPRNARGVELTARELLDRGVTRVDRELSGQPLLQAEMLQVIGRTYSELGLYDSAEALLARALELRRSGLGLKHPDAGETLSALGLLQYRKGEYERALVMFDEAIGILDSSGDDDASELSGVLKSMGDIYRDMGDYGKGQAALERALSISSRSSGEDSEQTGEILSSLAKLLVELGALDRAEELYERALRIQERELGANHPDVGTTLMRLATVKLEQGNLDEVEAMYRRNVVIQQEVYGPSHARLGMALNNLGHFLTEAGRNEEAVETLERALETLSAALGPHHPGVAFALSSLGNAHMAADRLGEARHYFERSVEVRRQTLATTQFDLVLTYSLAKLGRVEAGLENQAAAESALGEALALIGNSPELMDPRLSPTLLDLASWLAEQQRCVEAMPLLEQAARIQNARNVSSSSLAGELEGLLERCSDYSG